MTSPTPRRAALFLVLLATAISGAPVDEEGIAKEADLDREVVDVAAPEGQEPAADDKSNIRLQCPQGCGCSSSTINCAKIWKSNSFPSFPADGGYGSVSYLYLNGNNISSIPRQALRAMTSLIRLDVQNNKAELKLDAYSLDRVRNLQYLHLYNSSITRIPRGFFYGQSKLATVGLEKNNFTDIEAETFKGLPEARILRLQENSPGPQGFTLNVAAFRQGCPKLQHLHLEKSGISELAPGLFSALGALEDLKLNDNNIKRIRANTFQGLKNLRKLYLQDQLVVPMVLEVGAFYGLDNLQELYLDELQMTSLPAGAFNSTPVITKIDLAYNDLTVLPRGTFAGLTKLRYLDLRGNRFLDCAVVDEAKLLGMPYLYHYSCDYYSSLAAPATTMAPAFTVNPYCQSIATVSGHLFCGSLSTGKYDCERMGCCWFTVGGAGATGFCLMPKN